VFGPSRSTLLAKNAEQWPLYPISPEEKEEKEEEEEEEKEEEEDCCSTGSSRVGWREKLSWEANFERIRQVAKS
jgi:hypothetical protein